MTPLRTKIGRIFQKAMAALLIGASVLSVSVTANAATTDANGAETAWKKVDSDWYFYEQGTLQTGWKEINGKWYFLDEDGIMQTGWQEVESKWYFLNANGSMKTGWKLDDNKWYFLQPTGVMRTGWKKIQGKWYFFKSNGVMHIGWKLLGGKWYYFGADGAMVVGDVEINGKIYVFDASGVYLDPEEIEEPVKAAEQWSEQDLTYMYRCVQSEAGDADFDGRTHVASVIMNRVHDPNFGDTPYKVITAKNQFVYWRTNIDQMTIDAVHYVLENGDTAQGALFFHCMSYREYFCGHKHIFTDAYGHHFY